MSKFTSMLLYICLAIIVAIVGFSTKEIKQLTVAENLDQTHEDILAKMVSQEQYQINVLAEYIKNNK